MKINSDLIINGTNKTLKDVKFKGDEEYLIATVGTAYRPTSSGNNPLNFDTVVASVGNFTLSNKYIVIPEGVKRVKISANLFFEEPQQVGYVYVFIKKIEKGTSTVTSLSSGLSYLPTSVWYQGVWITPKIINVNPGDKLLITIDNTSQSKIRSGQISSWWLIEKVS